MRRSVLIAGSVAAASDHVGVEASQHRDFCGRPWLPQEEWT
ncbi:hypothetical protein [Rhizomonospora bruguierae]|nr:hypothetical protein [Micromonospora sp. NBRC 107566]